MKHWGLFFVPLLLSACSGGATIAPVAPSTAGVGKEPSPPPAAEIAAAPSAPATPETPAGAEPPSDDGELDDDMTSAEGDAAGVIREHPLDSWSQQQIDAALAQDPGSLGPISLGYPNGGALFNGVQMPEGEGWELVDPSHAWGTRETVDDLAHCIESVRATFPGTGKIPIGHISAKRGGRLSPHVSHQAGRDVDVGYYYVDGSPWYTMVRANNLDRPRTWGFVKALITDTDVEFIFMDRWVQRLVKDYAVTIGEDRGWLDEIFEGPRAVIHHARGHATHVHVRFYSPLARETGRRVYATMLKRHMVDPPTYFVTHTAKQGETLSHIAKKYGTTTKALQEVNGLRTTLIKAGKDYKIARHGALRGSPGPVRVPPRHVPPERRLAGPGTQAPAT